MHFSVVIPTAGESSSLDAALSVLNQKTEFKFEVILSGNPPQSLPNDQRLQANRIGLVPPGQARNSGVRKAKGDWIAFLDADCIARAGWLQSLGEKLRDGESLIGGAVSFPRGNYFATSDNVACFFDQTPWTHRGKIDTVASLNMACYRTVFEKIGPFDDVKIAGEDLEWVLRGKRKGFTPFFEPKAICEHRGGRQNLFQLIRHGMSWGRASIKVRQQFRDVIYTPGFFFRPNFFSILSVFVGVGFTLRIYLAPGMFRYLYTFPAVALSKIAWCMAASDA